MSNQLNYKDKSELVDITDDFGFTYRYCASKNCNNPINLDKVLCYEHYRVTPYEIVKKLKAFYGLITVR